MCLGLLDRYRCVFLELLIVHEALMYRILLSHIQLNHLQRPTHAVWGEVSGNFY
jgi:hypothetical protein